CSSRQASAIAAASPSRQGRRVTTPSESGGWGGTILMHRAYPPLPRSPSFPPPRPAALRYGCRSAARSNGHVPWNATRRSPIATATDLHGGLDLAEHGLRPRGRVYRNPTTSLLYTHALR